MIPHYDVAVVGFGPTGVVAAALLSQHGLRVYACDRLPDVYEIPRAISLDHEIQRIFQQIGVLDKVAAHCEPFTPSEYYGVEGQLIRRMTMLPPPWPLGHVPSVVFSQPPVERALRAHVASEDRVTVELGVTATRVMQDDDGVLLELSGSTAEPRVRAKYVIACDGGASGTRAQIGIELEDLDFDEPWLVVDVLVNEQGLSKLPRVSMQYCEPERPSTLVIGPGNHRRWEISLNDGEDPQVMATPERTWELLARWLQPDDGDLWRQASYRFHALVAERWRVGRVFVAGDAAHMQPPFLGQGMCQGMRDVANLSWKLAAVINGEVRGPAASALMNSYGDERKAHVRELTSRIKGVGAVICERDPVQARARDARLLAESDGVVRDTPRQDILPRLETGCLAEVDHPARGTLFPQPWLRQADGTYLLMDDTFGCGWRLVGLEEPSGEVILPPESALRLIVAARVQERDGVLVDWFARQDLRWVLVRPDHYVYGVARDIPQLRSLLNDWHRRVPVVTALAFT